METIRLRIATLAALTLALAGCVPRSVPPRPAPTPTPTAAVPVPQQTPAPSNWLDVPATPGDWSYRPSPSGGTALFGRRGATPLLIMRCDRAQRQVHLERAGQAAAPSSLIVRAEMMERTVAGQVLAGPPPAVRASIGANDRLLDAMALSKGRFAVEVSGQPTLYVPAWPEVTRVVEDCRS